MTARPHQKDDALPAADPLDSLIAERIRKSLTNPRPPRPRCRGLRAGRRPDHAV